MDSVRKKFMQLYTRWKDRHDNRGSAIVIVIIAMAMIGILATTLLWMSYMNYMIKVADIRNKNSFYSAEEVVEQIMAGLQQESASAVTAAYQDVTQNWANLSAIKADGTEDRMQSETNRSRIFATAYLETLVNKLKHPTLGDGYYDREKLKQYVDIEVFDGERQNDGVTKVNPNEGVNIAAWSHGGPTADPEKPPVMEMVNDNSLILHNIYVSYTDSENRVSIVQTDICIDVPMLVFENGGSIDGLYEYSLIGNEGISVGLVDVLGNAVDAGGDVTVEGSVFAGTDPTGKGGLSVNPGSTLTLDDSKRVISKGDIVVNGPAGLTVRDLPQEDARVYAQNITLINGSLSLDSKVYVANDLSLNGVGSKAVLSKEYYGYGASKNNKRSSTEPEVDAAGSSAIIINGKNSTIDMTGITRLLLAGRSYIGQAVSTSDAKTLSDEIAAGTRQKSDPVMMGESIAVKGGQIAYLVPAECVGTRDGEVLVGQNPVGGSKVSEIETLKNGGTVSGGEDAGAVPAPQADAQEDTAATGIFHEVDFNKQVYRLNNHSLSDFGITSMDHIRKVYAPYNGGQLLYYYLVLDENNAERYFAQYYNNNENREAIDGYFEKYAPGGILLGDFDAPENQYTILGNSLVSSALTDSGVTLKSGADLSVLPGEGGTGGTEGEDGTVPAPADPDAFSETGDNAETVMNFKDAAEVLKLSEDIDKAYQALSFTLTDDPANLSFVDTAKPEEYYVFNSIIKEKGTTDSVREYLKTIGKENDEVVFETGSGLRAVLTDKEDVKVSTCGHPTSENENKKKLRLIVATAEDGTVTVDQDFEGLIIARGRILVDSTKTLTVKLNKTDLYNVLDAKRKDDATDVTTPLDMFVNGGGSMANGAAEPTVDEAGNLVIDYSEIVRYMNWIKK